jgi:hypothetical protein
MKEATIIDDPELMMDVLFGGLAGLAAKEQQGIPNTSTNVSDRATMSGPIAAGSLVDLGRSKPADRVSLANFPASSAGVSQACIPETNPCECAYVVRMCRSDQTFIQSPIPPLRPPPLVRLWNSRILDRRRLRNHVDVKILGVGPCQVS